ncbi:S-adenosyl-L-methionine-dependent methyltransferase [Atractiella rhizophila]|nr:S-adenosyl-L-methionine-dependent methyltransferase [Atractiella rhizophila]
MLAHPQSKFYEPDNQMANQNYLLGHGASEEVRLKWQHDALKIILGSNYVKPLAAASGPKKILDLGYGSGHWCVEMAREFPDAEVIGIDINEADLSSMEPLPPNVSFRNENICNGLSYPDSYFDFVQLRIIPSIPNRPAVIKEVARILKPGGEFTLVEFAYHESTSTFPPGLEKWNEIAVMASEKRGVSRNWGPQLKPMLADSDLFTSIEEVVVRVPIGTFSNKPGHQEAGELMAKNFLGLLPVNALGWHILPYYPQPKYDQLVRQIHDEITSNKYELYWPYHFVRGIRI